MTNQKGQGLVEYALILALIAIVCIVALMIIGRDIADLLSRIGASI
jgi:pilus assembly protein Flp/PilA